MRILVGYASEHGSTLGVAERLAATLREYGHQVDVQPLHRDQKTAGYEAFVLGSAVHNNAWLPPAADFVRGGRQTLADRPVWLFSVGMARAVGGRFEQRSTEPREIAEFRAAVHPVDHALFAGAVQPDHLPPFGRIAFRTVGGRYGDFRDWEEIDAWAETIGLTLAERDHQLH